MSESGTGLQSMSGPEKNNTGKIVMGVVIVVVVLLIIGAIAYYFINKDKTTTPVPVPDPTPASDTSEFWMRKAGSGYSDGLTYSQSQSYCTDANAKLATVDQLKTAGKAGFEACSKGWLADENLGFYMQDTDPSGKCGVAGYNATAVNDDLLDDPYGTYCYGPIPADATNILTAASFASTN